MHFWFRVLKCEPGPNVFNFSIVYSWSKFEIRCWTKIAHAINFEHVQMNSFKHFSGPKTVLSRKKRLYEWPQVEWVCFYLNSFIKIFIQESIHFLWWRTNFQTHFFLSILISIMMIGNGCTLKNAETTVYYAICPRGE